MADPWREVERGYPDIVRADSSVSLPRDFRAYWGDGEHLWDVDWNNNWRLINWYNQISVEEGGREIGRSSDSEDGPVSEILHSGFYAPNIAYYGGDTEYLRPFVGLRVWGELDEVYTLYKGNGVWQPYLLVPKIPNGIEIAIFMSRPASNSVAAEYVTTVPFRFVLNGGDSQLRGLHPDAFFTLEKNGTSFGTIRCDGPDTIKTIQDTSFAVGDVLTVRSSDNTRGSIGVALSLHGELI